MLVAIERSKFLNLYKYDTLTVGLNSVLDIDSGELEKSLLNHDLLERLIEKFEEILPIFEEDHEVVFIEVDKSKVKLSKGLEISFGSVLKVIPLTKEGERLLFGRLNSNIKVESPKFEEIIRRAMTLRNLKQREYTVEKLFKIFNIESIVNSDFKKIVRESIIGILNRKEGGNTDYIHQLLTYNKTPGWLPSGNSEYLSKIACIAALSLDKKEDVIQKGVFFGRVKGNLEKINLGNASEGYDQFLNLLEIDKEFKNGYNNLKNSIPHHFEGIDVLKISYFYLALKSFLNEGDKDLSIIQQQINSEVRKDKLLFSHVLYLIGFTFSIGELYESIHSLELAALLKKTQIIQKDFEIKPKKPVSSKLETEISIGGKVKWETDEFSKKEFEINSTAEVSQEEIHKGEVNAYELVSELGVKIQGEKSKKDQTLEKNEGENDEVILDKEVDSIESLTISNNQLQDANPSNDTSFYQKDKRSAEENEGENISQVEKENADVIHSHHDSQLDNKVTLGDTEPDEMDEEEIKSEEYLEGKKSYSLDDQEFLKNQNIQQTKIEDSELIVRDFRKWVSSNAPKNKKVIWENFIREFFEDDNGVITVSFLIDQLGKVKGDAKELFAPSNKNKFDFNFIKKEFFKK